MEFTSIHETEGRAPPIKYTILEARTGNAPVYLVLQTSA